MLDLARLKDVKERYHALNEQLARPEVASDPKLMATLGPEHRALSEVVQAIERYEQASAEAEDLKVLAKDEDADLALLARQELDELYERLPRMEADLRAALVPKDPADSRDVIVEIRAGTGGDEAALFAGDLFRLYERFADRQGWHINVMNTSAGTAGGFKEVIFGVRGTNVFGTLKFENGVHRVQRVPTTESSGRLHTSAASVAVLPEATEVEITIAMHELKIDVYRSSGPGGQSVNTTDSAVRITHLPSGLVVTCQDEKSQHKNKDKAMRVLRSRLYEKALNESNAERDAARKSAVSSGDRSAKIRTYNFPQDRVTDHRLDSGQKNYPLHKVIEGDLHALIGALRTADYTARLAEA